MKHFNVLLHLSRLKRLPTFVAMHMVFGILNTKKFHNQHDAYCNASCSASGVQMEEYVVGDEVGTREVAFVQIRTNKAGALKSLCIETLKFSGSKRNVNQITLCAVLLFELSQA
ncbi:hypothetical protein V6N12_007556 [Hibiscus sabdariffa]|uniref:Uncharacterized protein n=1 Tax=Hibiscus sabdariffa TaxID=183260 RepID=A0ABR2F266_9ROSI